MITNSNWSGEAVLFYFFRVGAACSTKNFATVPAVMLAPQGGEVECAHPAFFGHRVWLSFLKIVFLKMKKKKRKRKEKRKNKKEKIKEEKWIELKIYNPLRRFLKFKCFLSVIREFRRKFQLNRRSILLDGQPFLRAQRKRLIETVRLSEITSPTVCHSPNRWQNIL